MNFRPSRSSIVLAAAIISSGIWFVGTLLGAHPDGSLLGFGGTLFSIYALTEQQWRSRERDSKPSDSPALPPAPAPVSPPAPVRPSESTGPLP